MLLDWRTKQWGKWRPCECARRPWSGGRGARPSADADGLTYEEAVEQLLARGVAESRASLDAIRPKLAVADRPLDGRQRGARAGCPPGTLRPTPQCCRSASASRRRLHPRGRDAAHAGAEGPAHAPAAISLDGFTVVAGSPCDGVTTEALYRHFERLFAQLRDALTRRGVSAADITDVFGDAALEFSPVLSGLPSGNKDWGPSNPSIPGGPHA